MDIAEVYDAGLFAFSNQTESIKTVQNTDDPSGSSGRSNF